MLVSENIIIDGVSYSYGPDAIGFTSELASSDQIKLLNGSSFSNLQGTLVPDNQIDAMRRIIGTQIINMQWQGVPLDIKEHLEFLHKNQKAFYIQFDEEMSFNYTQAYDITGERTCFFTPTYPIFPYGYTPESPTSHSGNVYLDNGVTIQPVSSGFQVNSTLGAILFDDPIAEGVKVFISYTWRCPVVVVDYKTEEYSKISKTVYSISATFLQVPSNTVLEDVTRERNTFEYAENNSPVGTTSTAVSVPLAFRKI